MIEMIGDGSGDTPFFGYLAYAAVHDPLHVPDLARVDHYRAQFEPLDLVELRDTRIARLVDRGLAPAPDGLRWPAQMDDLDNLTDERKADIVQRLAVYSALIEDVDQQIGRVIDHLRSIDEYENTLIVVASDNGAAGSGRHLYTRSSDGWQDTHYALIDDVDSYGLAGTYPTLSLPNAQVSSGPFFHTKGTVFEGGTRIPMIVRAPGSGPSGRVVSTFVHLVDLYPTFADFANHQLNDPALLGDSARGVIDGTSDVIGDDAFGMEWAGSRAYRNGDWKIVYTTTAYGGTGDWALFDLSSDIGEVHDVSSQHPEIVRDLAAQWDAYAESNGVIPVPFDLMNTEDAIGGIWFAPDWVE